MSDEDDFLSVATHVGRAEAPEDPGANPKESPHNEEISNDFGGFLTQYSRVGQGFSVMTPTIQTLPAGTYKLEYNQGRNCWCWIPMNLVNDGFVMLPDSKSEMVIAQVRKFWTLGAKFWEYNFLQKRGWLLYGPPGSGKTMALGAIVREMVADDGIVLMADIDPDAVAYNLAAFRQVEPNRRIVVVMEDIDSIIKKHGEQPVLALLDGESSINNVAFIATTNYPENLDGRIINRPSRFDRVIKIDVPNAAARRVYLESRRIEGDIDEWVRLTDGFSIAHIKELMVSVCCFGEDLYESAERLAKMSKIPKSSGDVGPVGFGA